MPSLDSLERLRQLAFKTSRFEPESDIQICEFLGEFDMGIEHYLSMEHPSADDDRWAGLCYIVLGNNDMAMECLLRAVERGSHAAKIDLARLYLIADRREECIHELKEINLDSLVEFNQALYYRVLSMYEASSDLKESVKILEKSWRMIQTAAEFKFVAPRILFSLAYSYQTLNKPEKAESYIARAEEICVTKFVWNLKINRADLLYGMHKFEECRALCLELISCEYLMIKSSALILLGCVELASMKLKSAENYLEEAKKFTLEMGLFGSYFIALSYLIMIYHARGAEKLVKLTLKEMKKYADNEEYQAKTLLREIYVKKNPDLSDVDALEEIIQFRMRLKTASEALRAMLYKIDLLMKLSFGEQAIYHEINRSVDYAIANDATRNLSEEWSFLSEVYHIIEKYHAGVFIKPGKSCIKIYSIDKEVLEINDQKFKPPFKKTLELIIYLLINDHATIDQLLVNVFGDSPKDKAKNYFHQIRHVVNRKIAGMSIEYDKASRLYRVISDQEIELDIQKYLRSDQKFTGIFLPSSGSDWVIDLNQRLSE